MVSKIKTKQKFQSFKTILNLRVTEQKGCVILQPYDMEVERTFHPATTLRSGPKPWKAAYVQLQEDQLMEDMEKILMVTHYYQFQV